MNFFHAWQYFAFVWCSEKQTIMRVFGLEGRARATRTALILFLAVGLGYGLVAGLYSGDNDWMFSAFLVVSLTHFWFDGFIGKPKSLGISGKRGFLESSRQFLQVLIPKSSPVRLRIENLKSLNLVLVILNELAKGGRQTASFLQSSSIKLGSDKLVFRDFINDLIKGTLYVNDCLTELRVVQWLQRIVDATVDLPSLSELPAGEARGLQAGWTSADRTLSRDELCDH